MGLGKLIVRLVELCTGNKKSRLHECDTSVEIFLQVVVMPPKDVVRLEVVVEGS